MQMCQNGIRQREGNVNLTDVMHAVAGSAPCKQIVNSITYFGSLVRVSASIDDRLKEK